MDQDVTSIDTVRAAARAAAYSVQEELNPPSSGGMNNFALYMWGGIAVFCAFFAATTIIAPLLVPQGQNMALLGPSGQTDSVKVQKSDAPTKNAAEAQSAAQEAVRSLPDTTFDSVTTGAIPKPGSETAATETPDEEKGETYGVNIGSSNSIPLLIERYRSLVKRAPDLFDGIGGRVRMAETSGQLQAQLIAGPFKSAESVAMFCRSIKLQLTVDCNVAIYGGDRIK